MSIQPTEALRVKYTESDVIPEQVTGVYEAIHSLSGLLIVSSGIEAGTSLALHDHFFLGNPEALVIDRAEKEDDDLWASSITTLLGNTGMHLEEFTHSQLYKGHSVRQSSVDVYEVSNPRAFYNKAIGGWINTRLYSCLFKLIVGVRIMETTDPNTDQTDDLGIVIDVTLPAEANEEMIDEDYEELPERTIGPINLALTLLAEATSKQSV